MKKTYIKPETTVVALNVRDNVLQAGSPQDYQIDPSSAPSVDTEADLGGREVIINSPNAWEEW